jgi:hypothetical protein
MIRYALKCTNAHSFESWFQSAEAYDSLLSGGMIVCPTCSDTDVAKTLMAPQVRAARSKAAEPAAATSQAMVNAPDPRLSEAIRELRAHVEKNSEYVGPRFASEARAMHEGDLPHRAIYGEARADEAKKLIEDGVPALPLPFIPKQKTN